MSQKQCGSDLSSW